MINAQAGFAVSISLDRNGQSLKLFAQEREKEREREVGLGSCLVAKSATFQCGPSAGADFIEWAKYRLAQVRFYLYI